MFKRWMLVASALLVACGQEGPKADESEVVSLQEVEGNFATSKGAAFIAEGRVPAEKRTALVYYVVDSEEPFMQAAVDYEIRALRSTCTGEDGKINWVAFVNSHYVKDASYIVCKDGRFSRAKLGAEIKRIIDTVSSSEYDPAAPTVGLKIPLQHPKTLAPMFKKYPLSHPEVLSAILKKVATDIFKSSDFTLTMHFKSHGNKALLLTGLTDVQLKEKTDRQHDELEKHLKSERDRIRDSNDDVTFRDRVSCEANGGDWTGKLCYCQTSKESIDQYFGECKVALGNVGMGKLKNGEIGMDATGLGRSLTAFALGELGEGYLGNYFRADRFSGERFSGETFAGEDGDLGSRNLGSRNLGTRNLGTRNLGTRNLGTRYLGIEDVGAAGLGVKGLGADNHFGTPHAAMAAVLKDANTFGIEFAFIVFESCDSTVTASPELKTALEGADAKIGGDYSASGSLWYRNFDWDIILGLTQREGLPQTKAMQDVMAKWSDKVDVYTLTQQ